MNFLVAGSVTALLGVALGAFGAHALKSSLDEYSLGVFEVGVRYQMYHSFALLFVGWMLQNQTYSTLNFAGWMFLAGIIIFSGSLYTLAVTGIKTFGAITPIGGLCFLLGWGTLVYEFYKK